MSLLKKIAAVASLVFVARKLKGLDGFSPAGGSGESDDARAARLRSTGVPAKATVLSIEDTGATMSNNPMVRLRVRIEPADAAIAPFEAEQSAFVSRIAFPRVGDSLPAFVNTADPTDWAFAPGALGVTPPGRLRVLWQGPGR